MKYSEVFQRLTYELAIVKFVKKDGTERLMLATRNIRIGELEYGNLGGLLGGHDKRCSIHNGNLAVIDMVIGECRCFSIDRLQSVEWLGEINTKEEYNKAYERFSEVKKEFEGGKGVLNNHNIGLDDL